MMSDQTPRTAYLEATVQSASPVRLVLMMYDIIVNDLQRAIEAIKNNDIEVRTKNIAHAIEAVWQLQNSLNMAEGGNAAQFLAQLYRHLRAKLLEAQIKQSASILQHQIELVQKVGTEWKKVEASSSQESSQAPVMPQIHPASMVYAGEVEASSTWTA